MTGVGRTLQGRAGEGRAGTAGHPVSLPPSHLGTTRREALYLIHMKWQGGGNHSERSPSVARPSPPGPAPPRAAPRRPAWLDTVSEQSVLVSDVSVTCQCRTPRGHPDRGGHGQLTARPAPARPGLSPLTRGLWLDSLGAGRGGAGKRARIGHTTPKLGDEVVVLISI